MARRCVCERLLDMVGRDPRLVAAGLAARMAFVELMRLAERIGTPGVIAFGSGIRNLDEVSLALGVRETELQTAVETLVERGVIEREGEALVCPTVREAGRKAAAARANGGLGGRPRKGESAEAARARRQGNLLLPVAGGKPTETETGTLSRATATTASSSELTKQASKSREETDDVALGRRVLEAAGIDDASWMGGFAEVRGWLALGLDAEAILGVVERVASRVGYRPARSLRYFTDAMRDAAEKARVAPAPAARSDAWTRHPAYAAWREACDAFRNNPYGAPPVMPAELAAARAAAA